MATFGSKLFFLHLPAGPTLLQPKGASVGLQMCPGFPDSGGPSLPGISRTGPSGKPFGFSLFCNFGAAGFLPLPLNPSVPFRSRPCTCLIHTLAVLTLGTCPSPFTSPSFHCMWHSVFHIVGADLNCAKPRSSSSAGLGSSKATKPSHTRQRTSRKCY